MKNDSGEKILTPEDILQEYKFAQKEWHDAEKRFQNEKFGKQIWRFIALAILCACFYNTKHSIVWVPDPDDRIMRVDCSDLWGIKKQTFYPVWRKPSGEDYESWCIKYPDGTWQTFLVDDGESVYYSWPLKNYSLSPKK
jgi:hypothetical protein